MDTVALKQSWALVQQLGDEAAAVFYSVLFASDPKLRAMFPASMGEQRDKLLKALGHIVANVNDTELLEEFAAQLGRDHRRFAVVPEQYRTVGRALIETLRRGLGPAWTPELEQDWRAAYDVVAQIMIQAAEQDSKINPPAWAAQVVHIERRSAEISVFTVLPRYAYPFVAGQSCAVQHPARPAVWRYLSPANAPRPDGAVEFHVRAVPGGQLSPVLTYLTRVGDIITLGAPVGASLTYALRAQGTLLLVAGGTGLAPLRAIVETLAGAQEWRQPVTLVVGAASQADLYDLPALVALQRHAPWLRVLPGIAEDSASAIDLALQEDAQVYREVFLCGSEKMVAASLERLRAIGHDPRRVHTETFTSRTYLPLHQQRPFDDRGRMDQGDV